MDPEYEQLTLKGDNFKWIGKKERKNSISLAFKNF
jgi:hypothetical protein